jgi:hypothetical protein
MRFLHSLRMHDGTARYRAYFVIIWRQLQASRSNCVNKFTYFPQKVGAFSFIGGTTEGADQFGGSEVSDVVPPHFPNPAASHGYAR